MLPEWGNSQNVRTAMLDDAVPCRFPVAAIPPVFGSLEWRLLPLRQESPQATALPS